MEYVRSMQSCGTLSLSQPAQHPQACPSHGRRIGPSDCDASTAWLIEIRVCGGSLKLWPEQKFPQTR